MDGAVNLDPENICLPRRFAISQSWVIAGLFVTLLTVQALGFAVLGTGRAGQGLSECILVVDDLLALSCAWIAFRRAQGVTALFWFLFVIVIIVLLVPTAIQAHDTILERVTLSDSMRGLIYCLYGAPILMMLFVPETYGREGVRSEIFLDLFQVAIVVSLIYSTFFFLPDRHMVPAEALLRSVSVSNLQSLLLMIAGFVRLQFSRVPGTRNLLIRLTIFLITCAVVTFSGDWVDVHDHSFLPLFDLVWAIPVVVASFIALTWKPNRDPISPAVSSNFLGFVGTNLVLVAMISIITLLMDHWKQAYGETLTNVAIAASLLALTLRLALTQFHQHQEIAHRKTAQEQLAVSHQKIALLLDSARRHTSEVIRINEFGTLLQGCPSRAEAFRVILERLGGLFPETSGMLSVLSPSRNRAEVVAKWDSEGPTSSIAREGLASRGDDSAANAASISIPLIARDEAIGVLVFEDHGRGAGSLPLDAGERARFAQLASALAEHIALTIANLDLREALQQQAICDPLTGLYNRRYMQESLERELHRARRRERPLSVMMFDIDHFKRYNDTFGHAAGDDALRLVAETLIASIRAEDLACRYGGEEFLVILPECGLPQAVIRAEEVRNHLRELYVQRPGELPGVITVSIGVAAFQETTDQPDLLLKFADEALYHAKHNGRDRVVAAPPDSTSRVLPGEPGGYTIEHTPHVHHS